jgi:hypothetical protein
VSVVKEETETIARVAIVVASTEIATRAATAIVAARAATDRRAVHSDPADKTTSKERSNPSTEHRLAATAPVSPRPMVATKVEMFREVTDKEADTAKVNGPTTDLAPKVKPPLVQKAPQRRAQMMTLTLNHSTKPMSLMSKTA